MHDPNQAYGDYYESDYSVWGETGYRGSSGYGDGSDVIPMQNTWDAKDADFNSNRITNPYVENPYEANVFDNAYTETFYNPNPTYGYNGYNSSDLE